eukprot:CAMPEP_0181228818 /NCGR_PEP_ID=MMETSP1096-20121128/33555_1 /TAXON_ID=156174 ORGANISM="Chrysochromulina ericina, Strain CCMP281" /NCGR_SAMPLE_ID=MMETSP1096 /ASSEMBLY_ACC=CAM_ASM_000453 /LENGTH=74 /DNA_ID=CAMNT_0023322377 /DNA_START=191 /DNA_END=415 /DNA_ORIENTATION=+
MDSASVRPRAVPKCTDAFNHESGGAFICGGAAFSAFGGSVCGKQQFRWTVALDEAGADEELPVEGFSLTRLFQL